MKQLYMLIWLAVGAACSAQTRNGGEPAKTVAPGVQQVGRLNSPLLTESSGVVASRQFPGVLWTHTDGNRRPHVLYAIERSGRQLAEFTIKGAAFQDWEDIAIDEAGHLYCADSGNNNLRRLELLVYQMKEPNPTNNTAGSAVVTRTWRLSFPAKPFDCESLFIWKGHGYVISKVTKDARAEIYRFPLAEEKGAVALEFVTQLKVESPVTSADLSPDGNLLAFISKAGAFVCRVDGDIKRAGVKKPMQTKFKHDHIEGCTFVPEGLLVTAESREVFLFTDPMFRETGH